MKTKKKSKVTPNQCPFGCSDPNCKLTITIALENSKKPKRKI